MDWRLYLEPAAGILLLVSVLVLFSCLRRRLETRSQADAAVRLLRGGPTFECLNCGASLVGLLPLSQFDIYYCRCGVGYTREGWRT